MKAEIFYQRLESAFILFLTIAVYHLQEFSWLLFGLLLFAPDIFMLGYIKNTKTGAHIYNLGHSYIAPAALGLLYLATSNTETLFSLSLIWTTHISLDRTLGYGLKTEQSFKNTHLGEL